MDQLQTYEIGHKKSAFWVVNVGNIGRAALTVNVGRPEAVSHLVTYDMKDRITGMVVELALEVLRKRGELRQIDNIMMFQLPPNNRNVQYVAYHLDFVKVAVDK